MYRRKQIAINCPEVYHIAELYRRGYGQRRIGEMLDRHEDTVEQILQGRVAKHRRLIGRLSNGIRPKRELAR